MALKMNASLQQRSLVASRASHSFGLRGASRVPPCRMTGTSGPALRRDAFLVRTKKGAVEGDAPASSSGPATGANVPVATDENFEDLVLKSSVPVIVDFWAPWCGPCRMIAPLIDEISDEYGDKLLCVKLNTDDSAGVANKYGIRSIPTVLLFKDGERVDTIIGAVPKNTLTRTIEKYM